MKGELVHEFSYYYLVEAKDEKSINTNDYVVMECDKGIMKRLEFKWLTEEELKNTDCRPKFASQILHPGRVKHIINKDNSDLAIEEYECIN